MLDYVSDLLNRPFQVTIAEEDAFFAMLCQAGYAGHRGFTEKYPGDLYSRYFPRYPELSLAWLLDFRVDSGWRVAKHLVKVWPEEHLAGDTLKLLSADLRVARRIGVEFGKQWMAQDPEASWLTLLNRYPQYVKLWNREVPFEQLLELAAGDATQIEQQIEAIPDPRARRLIGERFKVFRISRMPFEDGLLEMLTIRDKYVRSDATFELIEMDIERQLEKMDFLLATRKRIGVEEVTADRFLDEFLDNFAARILRSRPVYQARLTELVGAIRNPSRRLETMGRMVYAYAFAVHPTEVLIDYLATFPSGTLRDEVMRKMVLNLSPQEALAMAQEREEAWLRTLLLDRVAAKGGPPDELAAEYQSLRSATGSSEEPAGWRTRLQELLAADEHVGALRLAVHRMDSEDPAFAPLFEPALTESPVAVAGLCLLIERPDLRRSSLSRAVAAWAAADPEAAMGWAAALPGGADRVTALAALASDPERKADERVEALAWQAFLETGLAWLDEPGSNEDFKMYAFGQRWSQLNDARGFARSFAVLDEASVATKIAAMPDGESREMGQLGLYEHALAQGRQAWIDEFGPALHSSKNPRVRTLAVMARIDALPEDGLADAMAMAESMDDPEARYAARLAVVRRWHGKPYQAEIRGMLLGHADAGQRLKMAAQWLRRGTQDAEVLDKRLEQEASELLERQLHLLERIDQLARMPLPSMKPEPLNGSE